VVGLLQAVEWPIVVGLLQAVVWPIVVASRIAARRIVADIPMDEPWVQQQ
jgi:hypothetical protein